MSERQGAELKELEAELSEPQASRLGWGNIKWKLGSFGVVAFVAGIWELLPRLHVVSKIILPPFSDCAHALWELLSGPIFWGHFWVTLEEMVIGFFAGTAIGLVLGIALGVFEPVKRLTYPLVVAFQSIPKIVLAPVLITWFGYGIQSKIAMAIVVCFFPVLINTLVGLESVPSDAFRLMKSLQASRWQVFRRLSLPWAAPIMFAGIESGLTFAVIGAIVGEFVGASKGIGYLLAAYAFQLRIDRVYALIFVLAAIGAILYFIVEKVNRKLIFWRADTSG
jgi:NitT/TauT family transport system permease protein